MMNNKIKKSNYHIYHLTCNFEKYFFLSMKFTRSYYIKLTLFAVYYFATSSYSYFYSLKGYLGMCYDYL